MQRALMMEELVQKHTAIMDKYDPEHRVDLFVDEWGGWYDQEPGTHPGFLYQQNTMRDAMIAGATLNIFNNHADRVKMANLAQAVNVLQAVILTDEEKLLLTPTYYVMKMYKVHQDATLIPLDFESPKYTHGDAALPALSASASKDANGNIHFSIVNIDASKVQTMEIDVEALGIKKVNGEILRSDKLQDYNSFENPNNITPSSFNDFKLKKGKLTVTIPPFSVVVLEGTK
jgi:alpha-N-arabinofuranosidase